MKLYNKHPQQVFHLDWKDKVTGQVTHYKVNPGPTRELPDDMCKFLLDKWGTHFVADTEAIAKNAAQLEQIAERDAVIAQMTEQILKLEQELMKAQVALEALADKAEAEAAAPTQETAEPGAEASEAKRGPGRPKKIVTPVAP